MWAADGPAVLIVGTYAYGLPPWTSRDDLTAGVELPPIPLWVLLPARAALRQTRQSPVVTVTRCGRSLLQIV